MTNLQFAVKVFKRALKFSSTGRQGDAFSHMRNLDEALEEAIKAYNLCQQDEIEEIQNQR